MTTFREYKSQRPSRILYETISISNELIGDFHMINNQVFEKKLGGITFLPCNMEVIESQQSSTPVIDATVKFGRMASGFKYVLKAWRGSQRLTPIKAIYRQWDSKYPDTPIKTWTLYISDVSLDKTDVTCQLTLKNPLNANVASLYTIEEFPGLRNA